MRVLGLLLALLALSVFGEAHANALGQPITRTSCGSNAWGCTAAEAWQACSLEAAAHNPNYGCVGLAGTSGNIGRYGACNNSGCTGYWGLYIYTVLCESGFKWNEDNHTCTPQKDCATAAPLAGGWTTGAGNVCDGECVYSPPRNALDLPITIDGQEYRSVSGWISHGDDLTPTQCTTNGVLPTIPSDRDGDGSSDDNDTNPDNPGIGDPDDNPPPPDNDGDGQPDCGGAGQPACPNDPEAPHRSTGGGDCQTPPVSSGDEILGQIAFQTWATRCGLQNLANGGGTVPGGSGDGEGDGEGEGTYDGGGDCDTQPVVTGDPILAGLVMQAWATRCAVESGNAVTSTGEIGDCKSEWTISGPPGDANVEKLKGIRAEICGDDGNGDGQPDWTEGDKPADPGEGEEGDEPAPPSGLSIGTDLLDMDGILGGAASCPELGTLDFGPFGQFDLNSFPAWCDLVQVMRAIVLLMAAFTAIKILMGGV